MSHDWVNQALREIVLDPLSFDSVEHAFKGQCHSRVAVFSTNNEVDDKK